MNTVRHLESNQSYSKWGYYYNNVNRRVHKKTIEETIVLNRLIWSLSNIFLHNDARTFETFNGLSDILSQSNFRRFLQMHKNGSSNTQVDNHHENNDSHIFAFHIRMPAIPVPPIFFKACYFSGLPRPPLTLQRDS